MARIAVVTNLGIESYSGGTINIASSWAKNLIFGQYPDGRVYVTQRPSINIFDNASATVSDAKGRGIYYWNAVGDRYFVNADTVYKGDYTTAVTNTLSAGTQSVYMFEVGNYLVILDPENNEGWYINSSSSTTLTQITDVDFPTEQTPALQLAKGGAVINGTLYVGATDGTIWNSASEDPTSWASTDFTSAEVQPDNLVMLFEHNNQIAAGGTRTIEFFYDNANPEGSTLNVRQDFYHEIGIANHDTHASDGQRDFFVSLNPSGDLNVLAMSGFGLEKISSDDVDSYITSSVIDDSMMLTASIISAVGRSFYILTVYNTETTIAPKQSIAYDTFWKTWMPWEMEQTGIDDCPIVGWTRSTSTRIGEGILSNGDIVTVKDDKSPQDLTEAQVYLVANYCENQNDYISDTGQSGDQINWEIITGQNDFGDRDIKYMDNLRIVGTQTSNTDNVTVKHSDQSNNNYNTGRTIDMSNHNNKLTRLGKFRVRNFKLSGSGTEQKEIEGIEADVYR